MTGRLSLLVRHRIEDLIARTAEETIQRRIQGGDRLETLDREEHWEFAFREGSGADARLKDLVERAHLFVNPNKHSFRFSSNHLAGREEGCYLLLVRNRDDLEGAVAKETLVSHYQCDGLEEVRYGVVWVLRFSGVGSEEGRALAERIAVTRSRTDGLLINPHYQDWVLEAVRPAEEDEER